MPKYKAAIRISETWEVIFEASDDLTKEELEDRARELCFDPDHPEFDEDKRCCRFDDDDEVLFVERYEDPTTAPATDPSHTPTPTS